jgi:hypothetical protein
MNAAKNAAPLTRLPLRSCRASSYEKNEMEKWEPGARRERQDEPRHHPLRLRRNENRLIEHTANDKRLLEAVVDHYHETLKNSPEAQKYLVKRGLQSSEMVEQFRLGFANRTLGYRMPEKNRSNYGS